MAKTKAKEGRSRLGRGLSDLLQVDEAEPEKVEDAVAPSPVVAGGRSMDVAVDRISPNPHQPRKAMGPAALAELAASLKSNGVIQPLVVRPAAGDRFELIAGERRLRAAKLAELKTVPVVVRDVKSDAQAEMALVENVQREDLNPVDRAEAYRELMGQLKLSQPKLAERLGEDRSTIANHVRLLDLPPAVLAMLRDGQLSLGHAKVLAGLDDPNEQERIARLAVQGGMSVRAVERLVDAAKPQDADAPPTRSADAGRVEYLRRLSDTLGGQIGSRCTIAAAGRNGYKMTLHVKNAEQFDKLMERLNVKLD
jgi:ParB family chromosome partitioning protein